MQILANIFLNIVIKQKYQASGFYLKEWLHFKVVSFFSVQFP